MNLMKKSPKSKATRKNSENRRESPVLDRSQLAQNIVKSFRLIFRSIQAHSRLVQKESGVTSAQLWMLWEIFNAPGLKVTELAKTLSVHQSTCSNILDKLQHKELIKRARSGADQRVVHLFLTEKGTKLLAQAPRPAQGTVSDVLQRLPDETLINMDASLAALIGAMNLPETDADAKPLDL